MRVFAIVSIIVLCGALDILTKGFFQDLLLTRDISIIGDFLQLHLSYNTGIAFSIPITGLFLQILTPILVLGIFIYFISREYPKNSRLLDIGFSLVLGGALSHTYERILYGKVIDFIAVKYFAIFNFADIFISVGFATIILYYILYEGKQSR